MLYVKRIGNDVDACVKEQLVIPDILGVVNPTFPIRTISLLPELEKEHLSIANSHDVPLMSSTGRVQFVVNVQLIRDRRAFTPGCVGPGGVVLIACTIDGVANEGAVKIFCKMRLKPTEPPASSISGAVMPLEGSRSTFSSVTTRLLVPPPAL